MKKPRGTSPSAAAYDVDKPPVMRRSDWKKIVKGKSEYLGEIAAQEKQRIEADEKAAMTKDDAIKDAELDSLAKTIADQPRKDWRRLMGDLRAGRPLVTRTGKPWEINRPIGEIEGEEPLPYMNEALTAAADAIRYPQRKTVGSTKPDEAIRVDTREQRDKLIHLYHLLVEPPPLVYAGASVYGHFLRCVHDGDYVAPFTDDYKARFRTAVAGMLPQLESSCPFVINHNWKAVLDKAGEGETGEFRLPNDDCTVFEFAFQGMRALCIATDMPEMEDVGLHIWVRLDKQWIVLGAERLRSPLATPAGADSDKFYEEIRGQIRAACIMLESEVAERETIRADYKRNEKRERHGQTRFFDYHVVKLAHRHRLPKSDMPANDEKRRSPRLHWVRGHFRHYDNYKVWIKWFYRGDADLGFIDKEYRL